MRKEKAFKEYLDKKFADDKVVYNHIRNLSYFSDWSKLMRINNMLTMTKKNVLEYVKYSLTKPIKNHTINIRLNSIRKYYDCMIELGYIIKNPAAGIYIGIREEKVLQNPFTEMALNELYERFESYLNNRPKSINVKQEKVDLTNIRYKLILSLLVYQGLDTGEIDRLNVSDIDIKKRTINAAAIPRRKSRILALESIQLLTLYEYVQSLPANQEKLFNIRVHDAMSSILKLLKGLEPQLRNAEHLRQSRIMVWVGKLPIREAQYRIGHKYVSSTENYANQDISKLGDEISKLHLFR